MDSVFKVGILGEAEIRIIMRWVLEKISNFTHKMGLLVTESKAISSFITAKCICLFVCLFVFSSLFEKFQNMGSLGDRFVIFDHKFQKQWVFGVIESIFKGF